MAPSLVGAYAFKKDLYIRVDIITNMLSQKNQDKLRFIGYIITFAVFVIIARYSTKYALFCYSKGWTQNTPMRTPMWIPLAVIPFGSIIISFQNLLLMLNYFFKKIF
jgi:TRAP-type mannitol/chloroaromatic compound transport system permease small subunit